MNLLNKRNEINTFSNGCLGSHNDEERSEMRYVMRNAKPVSHQNFERNLHYFSSMSIRVSVHPHHKVLLLDLCWRRPHLSKDVRTDVIL